MYTSVERLKNYLPVDIDGIAFNDAVYAQVIETWSRYVDDQISNVYKVPLPDFPDTPMMITVITEYLATYDLYVRSGMAADKDDPRVDLWFRAHQMLDQIKAKEVVLAGTDEVGTGIADVAASMETGPGTGPMSFHRQNLALGGPHTRTYGGMPLWDSNEEP